MRSVNTTLITILPVLSMLIVGQFVFGQKTLGDFSFALLIGLVFGTYSSLFVASPLTTALKEREPRFTEIRKRLIAKGVDVNDTSWHGVAGSSRIAATGSEIPPRPSASGDRPEGAGAPQAAATGTATIARPEPSGASPYGNHPPRPRQEEALSPAHRRSFFHEVVESSSERGR